VNSESTKRLAILSVYDKLGISDLAHTLVNDYGFDLISSGGTAATLRSQGIPVISVEDYTGSPEMLGGRVKTLHPRIHGGILARPDDPCDQADLAEQGISPISLVVVNLYPFADTVADSKTTVAEAIEQIDIGGHTLIRAAAKNYTYTTVLTDARQYSTYLQQLKEGQGEVSLEFRQSCAQAAFTHILNYDQAISTYFEQLNGSSPFWLWGTPHQSLRYGENPHQRAKWFSLKSEGWSTAQQLQGKELSYNNLVDLEAARSLVAEFLTWSETASVIVKHTNPCGVALGKTALEAYQRALAADPVSAFGGIVALSRGLDTQIALALTETFLECVVAPEVSAEAVDILAQKKNLRVLLLPNLAQGSLQQIHMIAGGFLVQQPDTDPCNQHQWQVVTHQQPSPELYRELEFAWVVSKHVKSNAVVLTREGQTVGIGAGQMNRVGAVQIAIQQAKEQAQGAVAASDGFFPFADSVTLLVQAGIRAIIQPGGSIRDQESIDAANQSNIVMIHTGRRHFLH
jgi:phosphoribosylaminoimidazolecarboxamide formyltransferase/IMP cyclohydrolase